MKKIINANNYITLLKIDVFLITTCLLLLISFSFSYYNDSISIQLMQAKVGEFFGKDSDISIKMYKEIIGIDNKTDYIMIDSIPLENYSFDKYECLNDSVVTYNELTKSVNVISPSQDECKIYFKYDNL